MFAPLACDARSTWTHLPLCFALRKRSSDMAEVTPKNPTSATLAIMYFWFIDSSFMNPITTDSFSVLMPFSKSGGVNSSVGQCRRQIADTRAFETDTQTTLSYAPSYLLLPAT